MIIPTYPGFQRVYFPTIYQPRCLNVVLLEKNILLFTHTISFDPFQMYSNLLKVKRHNSSPFGYRVN